jgi:Tfp pilus assembly protein PilO
MDLDELKERYKLLPLWTRLVLCMLLGLGPGALYYSDSGEFLLEDLENAKNARDGKRVQFERARSKKGNLPKLEEQMAFTEQQLEVAKKQLPDMFLIEDLLQKIAAIANESGVVMRSFKPDAEPKPGKGAYKYMELGHDASVEGRYNNVAAFLDKISHLESTIFIKSIEMISALDKENISEVPEEGSATMAAHKAALESRKETKVTAKINLVAYRSMSTAEEAMAEDIGENPDEGGDAEKG